MTDTARLAALDACRATLKTAPPMAEWIAVADAPRAFADAAPDDVRWLLARVAELERELAAARGMKEDQ